MRALLLVAVLLALLQQTIAIPYALTLGKDVAVSDLLEL